MMSLTVLALGLLATPATSFGGVFISVSVAPPVLPVYTQPLCPGPGYIWTPGYWAYGPSGYYWVSGTWELAPFVGALWTPGYWGWGGGVYMWHAGYWGHHVGFYGGVNYGFGYTGVGYAGGYWHNGAFTYNRTVNHISGGNFHSYSKTVVEHETSRVSYNGGKGGLTARQNHPGTATASHSSAHTAHSNAAHAHTASHAQASHASRGHASSAHAQTASHTSAGHTSSGHTQTASHASSGHGARGGRR